MNHFQPELLDHRVHGYAFLYLVNLEIGSFLLRSIVISHVKIKERFNIKAAEE